jgi:mycofactocin precursor
MSVAATDDTTSDPVDDDPTPGQAGVSTTLVEEDLLVEDVSIDGMCGVY